jgi:hypothetical protein
MQGFEFGGFVVQRLRNDLPRGLCISGRGVRGVHLSFFSRIDTKNVPLNVTQRHAKRHR